MLPLPPRCSCVACCSDCCSAVRAAAAACLAAPTTILLPHHRWCARPHGAPSAPGPACIHLCVGKPFIDNSSMLFDSMASQPVMRAPHRSACASCATACHTLRAGARASALSRRPARPPRGACERCAYVHDEDGSKGRSGARRLRRRRHRHRAVRRPQHVGRVESDGYDLAGQFPLVQGNVQRGACCAGRGSVSNCPLRTARKAPKIWTALTTSGCAAHSRSATGTSARSQT